MEAPFPSYSPPSQVLIILSERSYKKKKVGQRSTKRKGWGVPMRAEKENWRHTQALKGPVYCLSSLPWSPHRARRKKKKSDRYQQRKKVGREQGPLWELKKRAGDIPRLSIVFPVSHRVHIEAEEKKKKVGQRSTKNQGWEGPYESWGRELETYPGSQGAWVLSFQSSIESS
jgi:hypothetical protein